ncbi:hypothetical protein FCR2A7T_05490 [Flavobacterium cauense R2A-7]|uniref:PepSY-like beta-lactamase-inhibitor n=1 Tax=Flavobacterium cauense R2A-7 TaxID=1341154 RepID=V6S3Y6_9FLAO|nr:hypothetical protein [Flavobacterium cauense]ESU21376.1 hypothetical protein FCR2A7T_05490 [Flavobacterium cauense R2A-7]TWI07897.1 hypothetical protein IP98_02933 [Flavobacterium cauense R2A-7]
MKKLLVLFVLILSVNAFAQKEGTYLEVEKVVFNDDAMGDLVVATPDRNISVKIIDKKVVITGVSVTEEEVSDSEFKIIDTLNNYDDYKSFLVEKNKTKYYIEFDFREKIKAVFVRNESGHILISYMR